MLGDLLDLAIEHFMPGAGFRTHAPAGHHAGQQEAAFEATLSLILSMLDVNPGLQAIAQEIVELWPEAATRHYEDGFGAAESYIQEALGPEKWALVSETVSSASAQLVSDAGEFFNGVHGVL